jgi:hypothetical protein
MKRSTKLLLGLALLALVSLALVGTAALAAADYEILWWSTDGGGGTSITSDAQSLSGSVSRYYASQESKEISMGSPEDSGGRLLPPHKISFSCRLPITESLSDIRKPVLGVRLHKKAHPHHRLPTPLNPRRE